MIMLCLYLHPSLRELLNPWAQISQIYQLKVMMGVRLQGFFFGARPIAGPATEGAWQHWISQGSPIPAFMDLVHVRGPLAGNSELEVVEETSRQQTGFLWCSKNWQHSDETEQNLPSGFCVGSMQGDREGHSNVGGFSKLCVLKRSDGESRISGFHNNFPNLPTPEGMLNEAEPTGSGTRNLIKAGSGHAWVCGRTSVYLCASRVYVRMYTRAHVLGSSVYFEAP